MLTTKEIAEELGVSTTTVREYADQGLIPCAKTLKGHRRFVASEVRSAIARRQGWDLEALSPGEDSRLDDSHPAPLHLADHWMPAIDKAAIAEARNAAGDVPAVEIPFLGVRGASRFAVEQGALA